MTIKICPFPYLFLLWGTMMLLQWPAQGNRGRYLVIENLRCWPASAIAQGAHSPRPPLLGPHTSCTRGWAGAPLWSWVGGNSPQRASRMDSREGKKYKTTPARVVQGWLAFRKCLVVCSSCGASSTTNSLTEWQQLYWQANSIKATATNKVAGSARCITNMESCLRFPKCPQPSLSLCMRGKGMNELGSDDGN